MLEIREDFKSLIPPLSEEERTLLEQSIIDEGCRDPLVIWDGVIVDGHNRYEICQAREIKFTCVNKEFTDSDEAKIWIIQNQLGRRNISDWIRFELIRAKKDILLKQGKETQGTRTDLLSLSDKKFHNTRNELASEIGWSTGKLAKAEVVAKQVDEETKKKLKTGDISINKAYKDIKNKEYHEKEKVLKDTSKIIVPKTDLCELFNCDILAATIPDNSLDAIITDPPYPKEFLDCWNKLAEFASAKLKEGGVLIAMSGQSYLPEVYKRMEIEGLNYYWTCCLSMTVSPDLKTKRLKTKWKPLLFYVKGEYNKTYLKSDVYKSEYSGTVEGQEYHKWGQSIPLMKQIIEDFTYAGEKVCDPFLGGGSTVIAGVELKRYMIGVELLKDVYETAVGRITDAIK